jgi:hypothetical protein
MPCRYDPEPGDYPSQRELDDLAKKACVFRAFILKHVDPSKLSNYDLVIYHGVKDEQYKHRAADLLRAVAEAQSDIKELELKAMEIRRLGGEPGEKFVERQNQLSLRLAKLLEADPADHLDNHDLF